MHRSGQPPPPPPASLPPRPRSHCRAPATPRAASNLMPAVLLLTSTCTSHEFSGCQGRTVLCPLPMFEQAVSLVACLHTDTHPPSSAHHKRPPPARASPAAPAAPSPAPKHARPHIPRTPSSTPRASAPASPVTSMPTRHQPVGILGVDTTPLAIGSALPPTTPADAPRTSSVGGAKLLTLYAAANIGGGGCEVGGGVSGVLPSGFALAVKSSSIDQREAGARG